MHGALIIALQREDIVLPADLALRKAIRAAYHLDHPPVQQEVLPIAGEWRPHRSLATSYLFSATFQPSKAPPVARARRSAVPAQLARAASGMLTSHLLPAGPTPAGGADFTDRCRTWAGLPLTSHEVIVQTIAAATTATSLRVHAGPAWLCRPALTRLAAPAWDAWSRR